MVMMRFDFFLRYNNMGEGRKVCGLAYLSSSLLSIERLGRKKKGLTATP